MKGELRYWEISQGGDTGSFIMNSTGVATGLQCGLIEVRRSTIFTVLAGWDVSSATAIDFKVDNGLSGIAISAGNLWPGHGRYFTGMTISTGQISYINLRDD